MREFLVDGLLHWQLNGESPCGAAPWPELGEGTTLFGRKPPPEVEKGPCPVCVPTKKKYMLFLQHGGFMSGWDIRPNEPRQ